MASSEGMSLSSQVWVSLWKFIAEHHGSSAQWMQQSSKDAFPADFLGSDNRDAITPLLLNFVHGAVHEQLRNMTNR